MALKSMKPLTRAPLLHVSVQESLRAYVHDNGLAPGTLLPAEGELAAQLGVSRNSLREGSRRWNRSEYWRHGVVSASS